jgi:photosystem II stability/assembly factor-like uncharacterized protein
MNASCLVRSVPLLVLTTALSCGHVAAQTNPKATTTNDTPRKPVEESDFALRRAQAFHDMYAEPQATEALATARKSYIALRSQLSERGIEPSEVGSEVVRPLPLSYPNRDINERLRILNDIATTRVGSGERLRMLIPKAMAVSGLNWRNIGPSNSAGRVSSLAVDRNNTGTIYRGTAGGGLWKSVDSGRTWSALTDSLGNLSVGAVAIAPSDSKIVYVGTGEGAVGIDGIDGFGFISSVDGGDHWALPKQVIAAKFFALSVHPTNPQEILAATSSGLQKSTDGGVTWTTTLPNLFGTEIVRAPGSPSRVLATAWNTSYTSGKGYIYRSEDSGSTWKKIGGAGTEPFPPDTGRLSLAIAPNAPLTLYVLGASSSGNVRNCRYDKVDQVGFFRSTDGGSTWTFQSNPITGDCTSGFDSVLAGQGWYANTLSVSPTNSATVYAGGLDLWVSMDGAKTWHKKSHWDTDPASNQYVHADIHALVWEGNELLIGDDGGMSKSDASVSKFSQLNTNINTRQYYSVGVSAMDRDIVIGGAQDNGTNIREGATSTFVEVIGGDGFASAVDPTNPKVMYGTLYGSSVWKSTDAKVFKEITPIYRKDDNAPFITPLTMDPNDPNVLYTATNYLWKTADGGANWTRTSNTDLGNGSEAGYVTKIAIARSDSRRILTTTGDGTVSKSIDGGVTWTRLHGLPRGYAADVEFDPTVPDTFYVSYMATTTGAAHVFKTTNGGTMFERIDNGLPENFPVHVVRVDPGDNDTLYAGTDVGLYRSTDGGAHWAQFGVTTGLPAVSVWDIAILPDDSLMRIATHGRGFFELQITMP